MHTQSAGLREFLPDASPTRVDLAPRDVQASGAERGGDTTLAQSEIPGLAKVWCAGPRRRRWPLRTSAISTRTSSGSQDLSWLS